MKIPDAIDDLYAKMLISTNYIDKNYIKEKYNEIYFNEKCREIYNTSNEKTIYDKYDYADWIRGENSYDTRAEAEAAKADEDYRRSIGVSDWDTPSVRPDVAERARQALEKLKQKAIEEQKKLDEARQKREAAERQRLENEDRIRAEEERLRLEAEEKRKKQEELILDDDRTLRDIS